MKKIVFVTCSAVLLLGFATVQAQDNYIDSFSIQAVLDYTDTGWGPDSSGTSDCDPTDGLGWGDDEWEFTNTAFGFLTILVEDCCVVGDYYEIWVDGMLIDTTPDPGYLGTTLSSGSATVWLAPGVHTIQIRDAAFADHPILCPAGYQVTGDWEPVLEFTKEITDTTEGGDGDGVLETGEDWMWTFSVSMKNLTDEAITVNKLHDRLGGDLEWSVIGWYSGLIGGMEWYTKGKTEKVFINFYDGFTLDPGQEEWLFSVTISPDVNPGTGNGKKAGHQEYTSPGEHCLNSGAWFEGYIGDEYIEGSTESICVEVSEAD